MTSRRPSTSQQDAPVPADLRQSIERRGSSPLSGRIASERIGRPKSAEEAEERYVAARGSWTAAMRAANSGRSTDLAALAIAQEAYEAALADRNRWAGSAQVAIPVEVDQPHTIEVVVGQELSWRRVHEAEVERERARPKGLRGIIGRLTRR